MKKDELEYMQFSPLTKYNQILTHCFTTRRGGVSIGGCSTLNLGFGRNDSRTNVIENFKRVCDTLNIELDDLVLSDQIHGTEIKVVDEKDRGKGIVLDSDIKGYDGLVTNIEKVALVTFYADCVPIYFFDPVKKVIGLAHSGWRGTLYQIAANMISIMDKEYNCNPEEVISVVGPSIGQCCFEIGIEVITEFVKKIIWSKDFCKNIGQGKAYIDLQGIIKQTLIHSGVRSDNIFISGICTKCNKDVFFSHRGDKGKTGSLAAIMQLRR
ncbi:MAG TPA: peptidoglycan editing factor PgeF [Clostridiales bacterium]|nr:peptidoglycan editing factor PgeF [Clostridiales bacterium]